MRDKRIFHVKLGDIATVKQWDGEHKGRVTCIGARGINVTSEYGDKFTKWINVIKIKKMDDESFSFASLPYNQHEVVTIPKCSGCKGRMMIVLLDYDHVELMCLKCFRKFLYRKE